MPPKASTSAAASSGAEEPTHWLMKAEPDTRIVKGKDVKFSIDDFEEMGTTPWDGVRNHEAKKIMKEKMKIGHQVLFYHSNTKVPGVYGLGEVTKEGYPDPSAFDSSHPYFDPKSNKDSPTWYLVDVTFKSRVAHPVTLALLKSIAAASSVASLPELGLGDWFGEEELNLIKSLPLINRGRLSVQPVQSKAAFDVVVKLGETGGWPVQEPKKGKGKGKAAASKGKGDDEDADEKETKGKVGGKKRRVEETEKEEVDEVEGTRKSARKG
ncbi:EVE domain-containing protein [Mrakia frigida]|uniref:EVE domain-containing protein n=1 Tax=Mrakia frigida TaxID=29902 RepID=UPI003FCC0A6C